jgi:hypothetical protein
MKLNRFYAVVIAGGLFFSTQGFSQSYGMAGCGLGSMVFKENNMMQIFAATTNGTSANQTFGITSGTSNCKPASAMAIINEQEVFMKNNLGSLSKEMAQGEGETLSAFATSLGCESTAIAAEVLQDNYSVIFLAPGAIAALDKSKEVLRANEQTSNNCKYINI